MRDFQFPPRSRRELLFLGGYYAACNGNFLPTFRDKEATTTRCVITHKRAVLVYFAAEAFNHAYVYLCGDAILRHVRSFERLRVKKATILDFCPFNMGPIGCLETSIKYCYYLLGNSPEGLSSHIIGTVYYHRYLLYAGYLYIYA